MCALSSCRVLPPMIRALNRAVHHLCPHHLQSFVGLDPSPSTMHPKMLVEPPLHDRAVHYTLVSHTLDSSILPRGREGLDLVNHI